jgi:hypothetical protein
MQNETDVQASVSSLARLLKGYGRGFWFGLGMAAGLWMTVNTLFPAGIRRGRVRSVSGIRPGCAEIGWSYGLGVRPVAIIFDLEWANGATGSVTVDGEALEAEIPFAEAPVGSYVLTAYTTYRLLSRPQTVVYRFTGTVAER